MDKTQELLKRFDDLFLTVDYLCLLAKEDSKDDGTRQLIAKIESDRLKTFLLEAIAEVRKDEREKICRQLQLTILFGEKNHFDDEVVDWPSRLRAFTQFLSEKEKKNE